MAPLQAGARALEHAISDLYGGDGITLLSTGHQAHFINSGQSELADLQNSISTSLTSFAPSAPVSSFTFDLEQGVFTRSTQTFGPLVAERAPTIGRLKLNIGASYTEAIYNRFQGTDLRDVQLRFTHIDCCFGPGLSDFELDQIGVDVHLSIEQRVAAVRATLGLTDRWDVGLLVPYVWNRLETRASAFIIHNNPDPNTADVHQFDPNGESPFSHAGGRAEGIGDLVARTKYFVLDSSKMGENASPFIPDVALLAQARFPTGRDDDLLGSGEYGFLPMVVLSREYAGIVEPHLNLGYEAVSGGSRHNSLQWVAGAALRAGDYVTIPLDLVGRHEVNKRDGVGDDLVDASIGIKINPFKTALLVANVRVPINGDTGLRADYIWSIGVEMTVP